VAGTLTSLIHEYQVASSAFEDINAVNHDTIERLA
jgi:hypothetical protein